MNEVKGIISSIETMGLVDGPGIRFVVFFQGCTLRCKHCHNPETWAVGKGNITLTPCELVDKIIRYRSYYGEEGGVTFSGGEPLLQPKFLFECLRLCKKEKVHTALDTAGVGLGDYDEILKYIDLVILDIKAVDKKLYKELTGADNAKYLSFLEACQKNGNKMWLRQVIVPGINDDEKHIKELANFAKKLKNVEKIELLPYKTIGVHKYKELDLKYSLKTTPEMDEARCKELEKLLNNLINNTE